MPVEDGYGLIKKIRALPKRTGGQTPALRLLLMRARKIACARFQRVPGSLAKPVDRFELAAVVTSLGTDKRGS
jgi:CheY-like chemotaxis protein